MNSRRILNSVCICVHDLPKMQVKLLMWGALLSSIANSRRILNSLCICACQKCRLNAPKWEALLSSLANSRRSLHGLRMQWTQPVRHTHRHTHRYTQHTHKHTHTHTHTHKHTQTHTNTNTPTPTGKTAKGCFVCALFFDTHKKPQRLVVPRQRDTHCTMRRVGQNHIPYLFVLIPHPKFQKYLVESHTFPHPQKIYIFAFPAQLRRAFSPVQH